jgi:hypothetical protein
MPPVLLDGLFGHRGFSECHSLVFETSGDRTTRIRSVPNGGWRLGAGQDFKIRKAKQHVDECVMSKYKKKKENFREVSITKL